MSVEGHQAKDGEDMQAFMNSLSPGYFETMRIPLLEGRDFRPLDAKKQATVAIVNRRFAEHFFAGKSAMGKRLGFGVGPQSKLNIEIVGVAADSLYEGPREGVRRQVFIPQLGHATAPRSTCGHKRPLSSAYGVLRNEVKQLDASMPVYEMKTLEAQLDETLLTERLIALLSAGSACSPLCWRRLASTASWRSWSPGAEKSWAFGWHWAPNRGSVLWLVMKEVLLLLAIGLAVGIPAAIGLGRFVSTQLYGIESSDPWIAGATMTLLALVSAAAG